MNIPEVGIKELGSLASLGKLGLNALKWYLQARRTKRDANIRDYLEWLRRQNHQQVVEQIQSSADTLEALTQLLNQLGSESLDELRKIAHQLNTVDKGLAAKLDTIALDIGELKRRVPLFEATPSTTTEATEFEISYLKQIAREFGRMQMLGVREMRDIKQSLSIAYVSLRLKSEDSEEDESSRAEDTLLAHNYLAIRGPAGSGKSTLLSWVAMQCSAQGTPENVWAGGVPFFIPLRRLEPKDAGRPDLSKLVSYSVDRRLWTADEPKNWSYNILQQQRAVLLIDGVDELPADLRPNLWEWVADFVSTHPGNRIYISSRAFPESCTPGAPKLWNPPPAFNSADLDEMNDADVRELVRNWHNAVMENEQDIVEKAKLADARDSLPEKLAEPPNARVRELCRSPLLCALVCALHWREEGYLPSKRVELYDRCCTMLIEERDAKRNIQRPVGPLQFLDLSGKELILQRLAWSMMRNVTGQGPKSHQIEVSREQAISWIKPNIAALDREEARRASAEELLNYLIERTGVLREPALGVVDFPHRTFQEYLAACAAGALNEAGDLAQRASDDQWYETIILAAGTKVGGVPFGNALVKELVDRGEAITKGNHLRNTFFALAVACLETGRQIHEELRKRVLGHLKEIVPPHDLNDARALAAAGDAVVPLLKYSHWKSKPVRVVVSCARTLALIGSQAAKKALLGADGYGDDRRANVLAELCKAPGINPLQVARIAATVQSLREILPGMVKPLVVDLSPISKWTSVPIINLNGCYRLEDLSPIRGLPMLRHLDITGCPIKDLSPLVTLQTLEILECSGRAHLDLSVLVKLRTLKELVLVCRGQVPDLTLLSTMTNLHTLRLYAGAELENLSAIAMLTRLRCLWLINLQWVKDFSPLQRLTNLERLDLDYATFLTDLTFIGSLTKLSHLDLRGCKGVLDAKPLAALTSLRTVFLTGSGVVDLSPFIGTRVTSIYVHPRDVEKVPPQLKRIVRSH